MVQRAVQVTWDDRPNVICSSKQFGPSSEKSVELEEQTSLFNEPETLADPKAAEPDLEQIVYKRKKQAGKRELDFSKLPTEQIVHELPEGEQACPAFLSGRTAQFGAGERTRTPDLLITNQLLYQLSYTSELPPNPRRLIYYIIAFSVCQVLFLIFFAVVRKSVIDHGYFWFIVSTNTARSFSACVL